MPGLFGRIQDIIQNGPVKVFEDQQSCRKCKTARNVPSSSVTDLDICQVEDYTITLCMSERRNIKSVAESVCGRGLQREAEGERYPGRTLYVVICGLKRYLND